MGRTLADENWDYYCGDTFQFWSGPKPPKTHQKYTAVMSHLKEIFHSYNIIKEVADIYINALVGRPFNWYLSADNSSGHGEAIEGNSQTEELLQQWWNWQQRQAISQSFSQGKPLAEAVAQMLVRDSADTTRTQSRHQDYNQGIGCGYLRLYTPQRYRNLPDPYKRIICHAPLPGSVSVERDNDGILYKATYSYAEGSESYELLNNGKTLITPAKGEPYGIDLGGRLPIFELKGRCLITESLKQTQNSINKTLTLKDENINVAGFLERVITNGQMPGRWEKDPTATGGERFVPEPGGIEMGANKITWLQGIPIGDPKSPSGYTSPSVTYRQPVDIGAFAGNFELDRTCAYMETGLGHLLSAGDGSLSGVSREALKQDFLTRLEGYTEIIEAVMSDIFSVVLHRLNPEWAVYTPVVELNLAKGEPLPEERAANREDFAAGLISRTTAMTRAGIADTDAEMELITREREEDLQAMQNQAIPPGTAKLHATELGT